MWITSEINYKQVKVYKQTRFGKRVKNGYELTSHLIYEYRGKRLELPIGYVWDGPSYPKFLEKILGKRNLDSYLAASAFHDASRFIVKEYSELFGDTETYYYIRKTATFYREMIRDWPNRKPTDEQSQIQYIGLLGFQWFYRLTSGTGDWKKLEENINN